MKKVVYKHSQRFQPRDTITVYNYNYDYDYNYRDRYGTMICPICNSEVFVSTFESYHLKTKKCRNTANL